MNLSTEKRFDSLDLEDKTTALTTYVQELYIDCKIVLLAATTETNDRAVSNKTLNAIMDSLPKTSLRTPNKKQRTDPVITPASSNKKSHTACFAAAKDLFNESSTTSFKDLLNNNTHDSDDESDEDMHANGTPADVVYSTNTNPGTGTQLLSTADTYEKLGWNDNCSTISTRKPGRKTNPIRCFTTITNS